MFIFFYIFFIIRRKKQQLLACFKIDLTHLPPSLIRPPGNLVGCIGDKNNTATFCNGKNLGIAKLANEAKPIVYVDGSTVSKRSCIELHINGHFCGPSIVQSMAKCFYCVFTIQQTCRGLRRDGKQAAKGQHLFVMTLWPFCGVQHLFLIIGSFGLFCDVIRLPEQTQSEVKQMRLEVVCSYLALPQWAESRQRNKR